jgi:hypothetical protein
MFKKTKIAAVTAAVLGVSAMAVVPTASADVTLGESAAGGQVLIFPYYNVNNGFSTSFNITNTKDEYKVVKMRFRESNTSNDVLDFNVYMSPYDVFTVGLTKTADGGVLMQTTDTTCTFPAIPAGGKAFIGADVYDSVSASDVREGYLEVIEMGNVATTAVVDMTATGGTATTTVQSGIKHTSAGVPDDCGVIKAAWEQNEFIQGGAQAVAGDETDQNNVYDNTASAATYYGYASVGTALQDKAATHDVLTAPTGGLVGSSVLIDTVNVAGFVAEPIAIDGYSDNAQHYLPSDQSFYLLPSLASGTGNKVSSLNSAGTALASNTWLTVARDFGLDDTHLAPNSSVASGINPMPMANILLVTSLANQYLVAGETSTDWVVAAPMRKHGIFNDFQYTADTLYDANNGDLKVDGATSPYWKHLDTKDIAAPFAYYDREEGVASVEPGDFSPPIQGVTPDVPFEREVNILALTSGGANPSVLGSDNAQTVTMDTGFVTGWGSLDFSDAALDLTGPRYNTDWVAAPVGGGMGTVGAPFVGFAAARGTVNGQNLGETFPMIIERIR